MRFTLIAVGLATIAVAALLWPTAGSNLAADDVDWLGYGDAVARAGKENKTVLVDVYTDWCGWCKKMDRDVYGDSDVQKYLAEYYVAAKLDAESATTHNVQGKKATEREIARAYGVTGYPATIFLNEKGETITILSGYVQKERFLLVLEYIHERIYEHQGWEDFLSSRDK
ncbi:thioredoxin fold domain-containing protein [bacterium]|nr:thioredoxin fold domain-containing protein [bacterium]